MTEIKGLSINITIDGIDAAVGKDFDGKTCLAVLGPERTEEDSWVTVDNPPKKDDHGLFANVFRKLNILVEEKKLDGPFSRGDHSSVFRQFLWFSAGELLELLEMLTRSGIKLKIYKISHKDDPGAKEEILQVFSKWMDDKTTIHSKIEEENKRREAEETLWYIRLTKADRQDRRIRRYIFLPLIILMITCAIYFAFTSQWWITVVIICLPVFTYLMVLAIFVFWFFRRRH